MYLKGKTIKRKQFQTNSMTSSAVIRKRCDMGNIFISCKREKIFK